MYVLCNSTVTLSFEVRMSAVSIETSRRPKTCEPIQGKEVSVSGRKRDYNYVCERKSKGIIICSCDSGGKRTH